MCVCCHISAHSILQDGSAYSIRVISSDGTRVVQFPNDYWGQAWACIEQQVVKYDNCPGTWTVQVACDNSVNACKPLSLC